MKNVLRKSFFIISFVISCFLPAAVFSQENSETQVHKGEVLEVIHESTNSLPTGQTSKDQLIKIKLEKGKVIELVHSIPTDLTYKIVLKKGDKILVTEENNEFFVEGYQRENICWLLLFLFISLVCLVGRKQGVFALISLLVMGIALIYVLIPLLKVGSPPLLAASLFCAFGTVITMLFVGGFTLKSLSATLGTIGGVVAAGLLGTWAINSAKISGLLEPEMQTLLYQFPEIQISHIISAGVLIGSLGAAMDVAMSIASSVQEVYSANPNKKLSDLYVAGMNVGKDVMGTMINTLILAYAGSSLPTIILITQINANYLFNMELVVKEIIMSIAGSIGLILTIPLTALLSSYFLKAKCSPKEISQ